MCSQATRILLAEDSLVLGEVLRFNLERAGFQVVLAIHGREAIEHLRSESFDVLVTDFEMPIMNGEELCAAIRHDLKLDHLPIIMCSAKGLELDFQDLATNYGVKRMLQKPFSISELVELVQTLVSESSSFTPA